MSLLRKPPSPGSPVPRFSVIGMEDKLQVGVITQTHGVHGEVKVFPTTDDMHRFSDLDEVILDTGKDMRTLKIERVRFFKQYVIVKFKGFDNPDDIEKYKGCPLLVERRDAVPLAENEYFIADLVGLAVITDSGEELGTLTDVIPTGANDVYSVRSQKYGEVLLPAIRDCILNVDLSNGQMKVHLMEGLI